MSTWKPDRSCIEEPELDACDRRLEMSTWKPVVLVAPYRRLGPCERRWEMSTWKLAFDPARIEQPGDLAIVDWKCRLGNLSTGSGNAMILGSLRTSVGNVDLETGSGNPADAV